MATTWMGDHFMLGFPCEYPRGLILCRLCSTQKSCGWDCKLRSDVLMLAKRSGTHVKDPVVHVRVHWIMGKLKRTAFTTGCIAWLSCSWLSPGRVTWISHGRYCNGTIQLLNFLKKNSHAKSANGTICIFSVFRLTYVLVQGPLWTFSGAIRDP